MKFSYIAVTAKNKIEKGVLDAPNLKQATKLLVDKGWFVRKISSKQGLKKEVSVPFVGRVSMIDKALFARHLSTMIKSGISIDESLEVIKDQTTSAKFKKILADIVERISTGQSLSKSLQRHPKTFDPFFINIINVGEQSGTLEQNLEYLAEELEDRMELRRNIRAAALYPSIVLAATFGLGIILAYFVLPKITRLFETLDFELPLSTKILLWVAHVMDNYGTWVILGLILFVIVFKVLISLKSIRPYWHRFILRLPIFGRIIKHYNLSMLCRTMAILLKSGLTIDRALDVTAKTMENRRYRQGMIYSMEQVKKGNQLSTSLQKFKQSKRSPLFELLAIKMISVGERSGRLDESFVYLAEYYEEEVGKTTENLTTILEPLLLVVVGLIVGFIAISVISPIYQVTGQFRR